VSCWHTSGRWGFAHLTYICYISYNVKKKGCEALHIYCSCPGMVYRGVILNWAGAVELCTGLLTDSVITKERISRYS